MARNLAHEAESELSDSASTESTDETRKELLNRREYLQFGAAAVAVVTSIGPGLSSSDGQTLTTDFSEYAR